jgi:hypothetical protein
MKESALAAVLLALLTFPGHGGGKNDESATAGHGRPQQPHARVAASPCCCRSAMPATRQEPYCKKKGCSSRNLCKPCPKYEGVCECWDAAAAAASPCCCRSAMPATRQEPYFKKKGCSMKNPCRPRCPKYGNPCECNNTATAAASPCCCRPALSAPLSKQGALAASPSVRGKCGDGDCHSKKCTGKKDDCGNSSKSCPLGQCIAPAGRLHQARAGAGERPCCCCTGRPALLPGGVKTASCACNGRCPSCRGGRAGSAADRRRLPALGASASVRGKCVLHSQ